MIERIFTNWKTTLVGSLIFFASFALVMFEKATLTEVGAFFGIAFALFFAKDGVKK